MGQPILYPSYHSNMHRHTHTYALKCGWINHSLAHAWNDAGIVSIQPCWLWGFIRSLAWPHPLPFPAMQTAKKMWKGGIYTHRLLLQVLLGSTHNWLVHGRQVGATIFPELQGALHNKSQVERTVRAKEPVNMYRLYLRAWMHTLHRPGQMCKTTPANTATEGWESAWPDTGTLWVLMTL